MSCGMRDGMRMTLSLEGESSSSTWQLMMSRAKSDHPERGAAEERWEKILSLVETQSSRKRVERICCSDPLSLVPLELVLYYFLPFLGSHDEYPPHHRHHDHQQNPFIQTALVYFLSSFLYCVPWTKTPGLLLPFISRREDITLSVSLSLTLSFSLSLFWWWAEELSLLSSEWKEDDRKGSLTFLHSFHFCSSRQYPLSFDFHHDAPHPAVHEVLCFGRRYLTVTSHLSPPFWSLDITRGGEEDGILVVSVACDVFWWKMIWSQLSALVYAAWSSRVLFCSIFSASCLIRGVN